HAWKLRRLRALAEGMDAALKLCAAPSTAARIRSSSGAGGAWLAADAGIAFIVEREPRNVMLFGVSLNLAPGPVGKNADLLHLLAAGQAMVFDLFEVGSGR